MTKVQLPSKEKIYADLAKLFKYTPEQISDMTPHQQYALIDPAYADQTISFATQDEFLEWKMMNGG